MEDDHDDNDDALPRRNILSGFVGSGYPEAKRQILLNGLRSLRHIHANRGFEYWQSLLAAYTMITEEIVDELKAKDELPPQIDFRDVDTGKGSPFQRRFLPRWEAYEALEQRNDKPLTKAERSNLRELVRNSAILMWYAGLAPHKQRQLTHPNRIIVAWKAANRSATGDDAKPSLAKTQQRIILQQDEEIAGHKQRVTTMQALLEDRDWKAAEHIEDKVAALGKELRTRNAGEQVRAVRLLADRLGITADLLKLLMRKSKGGGR